MKKNKKIAVALSGGIDSLVAAYLLKKQGADLVGIHFQTGYENKKTDLAETGIRLGIEIRQVNLAEDFEIQVINYFIKTYLTGKTPNPCIICNKKIKFNALYKACKKLGANFIATGHYAGLKKDASGHNSLVKADDPSKDQSYFLAMLSQEQLDRSIFPLGNMHKSEVKKFADLNGLIPDEKNESQDICFIKQNSFSEFILKKKGIKPVPGKIIRTDGKVVGTHNGLHEFTIGQRRGLNCPGPAPYHVKKIDIKNNALIVGFKEELFKKELFLDNIHFTGKPITHCRKIKTKIRYRHKEADSVFIPQYSESSGITDISKTNETPETSDMQKTFNISGKNRAKIIFNEPQYAVTPGQIAVFYDNDQVLGCGTIQ